MRKTIRWTALTAVLLMLLTMLPLGVAADNSTEIRVILPQTVQAGEQFAATIDLQHNTGWAALQFAVTYDATQMELVDVEMGEKIVTKYTWFEYYEPTPGTLNVMSLYNDAAPTQAESGSVTANGTWATMIFSVKKDLAQGTEIAVKAKLVTMVNAQLKEQLKPNATFTGTAKVGALSAQDKQTQPSMTKGGAVVSGGVTGVTGQFGTANNNETRTTAKNAAGKEEEDDWDTEEEKDGTAAPTVITSVVTNAAGQTSIVTMTQPAASAPDKSPAYWLWILIGALVVVAVAVVWVILRRKKA